jgi:ribosome biogenesis protein MAK21
MGVKRTKEKKKAEKPTFDETALAQLTSRIDKSLGDAGNQFPDKRKRQRDSDDGPDSKRRQTRLPESKPQGDLRDGRKNKQPSALLDEILALGGDEDDLELVANLDCDNEGGGAPQPKTSSETPMDKSLRDELAQFASSLGFNKVQEDEDPDTDDDNGDDRAMEDLHSSGAEDDSEEEEEDEKAAPPPPPQETRQGRQSGKLVSKEPFKVPLAPRTEITSNRV